MEDQAHNQRERYRFGIKFNIFLEVKEENQVLIDKLRVYVESLETPNTGQDLNYLFQLVLSYK